MSNFDRQPVGTGPYQLSEYRAGQFIRLQRHDDFWRGKPLMPQVVVDLGSGGTGRLSKLLTGECDVLARPAASQLSILRDDPRLRLTLRPGMNVAYLAFNTAKPPLNNPAVRHALALAINNQRLMQSIYYGTAETAASILPRASWAYDNEAKITEYNPAKSREQLKALGLENLTLKLWVPTRSQAWNPSPLKTAELIQADMAQVGVKVVIVPVEGRFQEARLMDMSHDLTLSGWATDSNDPTVSSVRYRAARQFIHRPTSPTGAIRNSTACCVRRSPRSSWQRVLKPMTKRRVFWRRNYLFCRWRRHCVCRPIGTISKVWYLARLVTPPLLGCIARNRMR